MLDLCRRDRAFGRIICNDDMEVDMKTRIMVILGVLACLAAIPDARASTGSDEVDTGCAALGVALGALAGYAVGQPFGPAATAMTVAVSSTYGSAAIAQGCKNYYESLKSQKDKFDYQDFVDTVCGGNPYGCPNGMNVTGSFPDAPAHCDFYIVCNIALAVGSDASLTVQDLISAGTFVDFSYQSGYWDFHNYGYLVGVHDISMSTYEY
jgi:hypothetical protein